MPVKNPYKFSAASANELTIFGSARPGYTDLQVRDWIEFMQAQDIQRICCLLSETQLSRYSHLLTTYQHFFGSEAIGWTPIEDFQLVDYNILIDRILPFLFMADRQGAKVVVHCSGGIGRTGQILAAWLVAGCGYDRQLAISTVRVSGRNPYEAAFAAPFKCRSPWRAVAELYALLDRCADFRQTLI